MEPKTDQYRHVAEYFKIAREEINSALERYAIFESDCPKRLADAIRYSLLAPGKRLRPTLAFLAAELCGGERQDAIPVAVALESVHTYSLVHDDLPAMDDDDLRRGRPTNHIQFDEATAILVGDALQAFAFEMLGSAIEDSEIAQKCVFELARRIGASGMVGGQEDDVMWSATVTGSRGAFDVIGETLSCASDVGRDFATLEFLRKIHRRKTGALIVASLKLGAFTSRATSEQLSALERYGQALGQAFQITDDLLDAVGDDAALGKRVGKDAESGKLTYVSLYGVEVAKEYLQESVTSAQRALSENESLFGRARGDAYAVAVSLPDFLAKRER